MSTRSKTLRCIRLASAVTFTSQLWSLNVATLSNVAYWTLPYEFWYYVVFACVFYFAGTIRLVLVLVVAAYFLVTRLMKIEWVFLPAPLLWTVGLAILLTLIFGFAGTWRALGAKAAPYLRNE